jgi:hypothetical protein
MKRRTRAAIVSTLLVIATTAAAARAVTPEDLIRAGRAAVDRLAKTGATWTSVVAGSTGRGGSSIVAQWYVTPAASRLSLSAVVGARVQPITSIVVRDGAWYVTDGGRRVECQPFAYPFDAAAVMAFYWTTPVQPIATLDPGGHVESVDGDRVVYRAPLDPAAAAQVAAAVDGYDAALRAHPELAAHIDPATVANFDRLRDIRLHGSTLTVDARNGVVIRRDLPNQRTVTVSDFAWIDRPDPAAVDVSGTTWEDRTAGPMAVADLNDLALMNVDGAWRPGQRANDTDARVVNVRTGDNWRVPFRGLDAMAGAFLPDRRSVVVAGLANGAGGLRLYAVDLRTGDNRPLGGPALAVGNTVFPSVSPDGTTVAALHAQGMTIPMRQQVYLIDLATGESEPVGPEADYNGVSWLPDGTGLVLLRTADAAPGTDFPPKVLVRMTRDGRVTELRPGGAFVVLPREKRILFQDDRPGAGKNGPWTTCDLSGGDPKLLGDGLAGYGFPAVSPDGGRLLMIRLYRATQPHTGPVIFDLPGLTQHDVPVGPGLWTLPAW